MRKDVNRSLLLWPAAASAAIIAGSWLHQAGGLAGLRERAMTGPVRTAAARLAALGWLADEPQAQVDPLVGRGFESPGIVGVATKNAERPDGGTRAPKLPHRLAVVFGTTEEGKMAAPRLDERGELAGLARRPSVATAAGSQDREVEVGVKRNAVSERVQPISSALTLTLEPPRVDAPASVGQVAAPAATGPRTAGLISAWSLPEALGSLTRLASDAAKRVAVSTTPSGSSAERAARGEAVVSEREVADPSQPPAEPTPWPVASRLEKQLKKLASVAVRNQPNEHARFVSRERVPSLPTDSPAERWSGQVASRLAELNSLSQLSDDRAGVLIDQLAVAAADGLQEAEQSRDRVEQLEWLRAGHALARRVAVWDPVWKLARQPSDSPRPAQGSELDVATIAGLIGQVRLDLVETGDPEGWNRYLLLDEIQRLALQTSTAETESAAETRLADERALLAQRFLSRLQWHGLSPAHHDWLDRDSVNAVAELVRLWNYASVDVAKLLEQLESQESDSIDLAALEIADAVQSLRFAPRDEAVRVSESINTYYRNANVRIAISGTFLQRLLPEVESKTVPLRTVLFGSRVRGQSQIESDLRLRFAPAPDRWSLSLETIGSVRTDSVGQTGPVAVRTAADSQFLAATPIEVTSTGVVVGDSQVDVAGQSRLRGVRSDYDGWPLIGTLVRSIAAGRYEELKPRADRVANGRVKNQVGDQVGTQVDAAVQRATDRLSRSVLGPLGKLQLNPMVVDMETTEDRLLSRYRLAGDWQLAAYTPRPRAPQSSLMSLQIHQSAINNTLEQLAPNEESRSIADMVSQAMELFERREAAIPDDIPSDVMIQFARTRPVTVEIEEGMLWITLRIVRLSDQDRLDLRRFIVRAAYRPEVDGLNASLVREGHLSISGPDISMRERLPARVIFNKVLSADRPLPLTLPALTEHPAMADLAVSQLELRDGWIGLAISEEQAPRIALRVNDEGE